MPPRAAQAARTHAAPSDIAVLHSPSPSPAASGTGSAQATGPAEEALLLEEGRDSEAGPVRDKDRDKGKGKGGKDRIKTDKTDKKSQRPSWSCTECTRRKIRCDRVVPGCNQCIKRNKVHLCRLDQDADMGFSGADGGLAGVSTHAAASAPSGPPRLASAAEYDAIARQVTVVRQRLYHLERVVRAFVPQPDSLDPQGQPMWAVDLNLLQQHDSAAASSSSTFPTPTKNGDSLPLPVPGAAPPAPPSTGQPRDSEVEAATTLEFLALGRDSKESHFRRSELRRPSSDDEGEAEDGPHVDEGGGSSPRRDRPAHAPAGDASTPRASLADVLPSVEASERLVDYSLDNVLWQHGGVHSGQFRRECAEFHSWGAQRASKVNQAWLALYYAMLCVAVKHMTADDAAAHGYAADEQRTLAKRYFDASIDSLHRSNFLAKHQVYAVQTINLYAVSCQDVGESDLIATLLAAGIRIAQHLKMHLFGADDEWDAKRRKNGVDPKSEQGVKGLIEREIRKRVWYGLLTEDWVSSHGRRATSVSATQFTTPLPLNCTDADLSSGEFVNRSKDEPTPVSKTILLYHVADCLRRFFEHIHSSKQQLDYTYCIEADRALRSIILDGPAFLKADPAASASANGSGSGSGEGGYPVWVPWFRNYWVISISHKLLVVHRMFVAPAGHPQDERQLYSRRVTIEAARSVIQQLARSPRASTQSYWTLPYHTISAATTIMLDIFQAPSDPDVPHKRLEVQHALHELQQLASGSHIAKRGVALLGTLLAEEARHRAPREEAASQTGAGADAGEGAGFDGAARHAASSGLSLGSPGMAAHSTPFFVPTLAGNVPLPVPSAPSTLPLLPAPSPGNATAGPPAAPAQLTTAPLSAQALEALFSGLGGDSALSHEAIAGGDASLAGLDLDLGAGGTGDGEAAAAASAVDFWRMLNAGGGVDELGEGGVAGGDVGMTGIEGGMGEWASWPQ